MICNLQEGQRPHTFFPSPLLLFLLLSSFLSTPLPSSLLISSTLFSLLSFPLSSHLFFSPFFTLPLSTLSSSAPSLPLLTSPPIFSSLLLSFSRPPLPPVQNLHSPVLFSQRDSSRCCSQLADDKDPNILSCKKLHHSSLLIII